MTDLHSSRTLLRPFLLSEKDFENLRKLDSDPDIMKFTPAKVPQTQEQTRARLERYSKMKGVWAAELKETGEFVGWFMLTPTDLEFPELGFMLVKKFWGQGLATEIAAAIADYAFSLLGHNGLSARTNHENVASIAVLKKLGFVLVRENAELKFFQLHN